MVLKLREVQSQYNNGQTYIYMAFCRRSPLVSSNGVPATAR